MDVVVNESHDHSGVNDESRSQSSVNDESFNPWSIVNLVFHHLVDHGLHPVLGESGDPGAPARELLLAMGIEPSPEGNREVMRGVRAHLDEIRSVVFGETPPGD